MVITIDVFLKLCAGISCVGLALSYLIKAINSVRKPVKDVSDKFKSYDEYFQRDKKRIECVIIHISIFNNKLFVFGMITNKTRNFLMFKIV